MADNLHRSLMLVTCLSPEIGYEHASAVAHKAYEEGTSLREACLALGYLTGEEFDAVFHPAQMVSQGRFASHKRGPPKQDGPSSKQER